MAYIEPNSTLWLFKDIPFDMEYNDTMYFPNRTAQEYWFEDRLDPNRKYSKLSYQRKSKGVIKLEESMGNVYNCNYMMFKNDSFENKWFYAFITNVEYINNATVEISYVLDVVQTWLIDATFSECFIQRQHSETDGYGENLQAESPFGGPYVYDELSSISYDAALVIVTTFDINNIILDIPFELIAGYQKQHTNVTASGCHFYKFEFDVPTDMALAELFLAGMAALGKSDEIVCMLTVANDLWEAYEDPNYTPDYHYVTPPSTLGTYTPRNKKLLSYPYYGLSIIDYSGKENIFRQELFDNLNTKGYAMFEGWENRHPISSIMLIPHHYMGKAINMSEAIESPTCPECSWKNDQFLAWLAQNLLGTERPPIISGKPLDIDVGNVPSQPALPANNALSTYVEQGLGPKVTSGAGMEMSTLGASGSLGAIEGVVGGLAISAIETCLARVIANPSRVEGNINNITRYQLQGFEFTVARKHITPEFAEKIDKYFDMFGYTMNKVAVPNLHARPKYTYVKTIGSNIHGLIPASAAKNLEDIFNKGIRFWDSSAVFGDFSQNNSPVT